MWEFQSLDIVSDAGSTKPSSSSTFSESGEYSLSDDEKKDDAEQVGHDSGEDERTKTKEGTGDKSGEKEKQQSNAERQPRGEKHKENRVETAVA